MEYIPIIIFSLIQISLLTSLLKLLKELENAKIQLDRVSYDESENASNYIKDNIRNVLGIILTDREADEIRTVIEDRVIELLNRAEYESVIKDELRYEGPYNLDMQITLNRSMGCVFVNVTEERNKVDKVEFGFVYHIDCELTTAMVFNKEENEDEMVR